MRELDEIRLLVEGNHSEEHVEFLGPIGDDPKIGFPWSVSSIDEPTCSACVGRSRRTRKCRCRASDSLRPCSALDRCILKMRCDVD